MNIKGINRLLLTKGPGFFLIKTGSSSQYFNQAVKQLQGKYVLTLSIKYCYLICGNQYCYLQPFTDPATVLSMFMLLFILVIVCGLFQWERISEFFFIYIPVRDSIINNRGRVGILLTSLTQARTCIFNAICCCLFNFH